MLQKIYNLTIRNYLPRTWGVYRGIPARDVRLLDLNANFPNYKAGFLNAIEEYVPGRSVELVGFGRGVSTVTALDAGARHVTAYEAAEKMIQLGIETLEANRCELDRVTIQNALVGEAHNVYGQVAGAERVPPSDLCEADCLVLDCEGAEREILRGIGTPPDIVIVESHPYDDAPTTVVSQLLKDLGYSVTIRDHTPDAPENKHIGWDFTIVVFCAVLNSGRICGYRWFRRVKPRRSNLPWKSKSSILLSSVVTY